MVHWIEPEPEVGAEECEGLDASRSLPQFCNPGRSRRQDVPSCSASGGTFLK